MKEILLMSSGMDSFMTWRLLKRPDALYCAIGHAYEERERTELARLRVSCERAGLPLALTTTTRVFLGDRERSDGHVPLRNLFFAACAAIQNEKVDTIYLGALRGESSQDKSGRFFRRASVLLSQLCHRRIRVVAPFRHLTKTQLVQKYLETYRFEQDIQLLLQTYSCYNSDRVPDGYKGCGECMACFRRWVAMTNNGLHEKYVKPPQHWHVIHASQYGDWYKAMVKSGVTEWPGIIQNNVEAARALIRGRHVSY